jgi:hypothetical protein
MYCFNQLSPIRPYHLDKGLDDFQHSTGVLTEVIAQELLAYYRGEKVTMSYVNHARRRLCHKSTVSLPEEEYKTTVKCTDGDVELKVSMATLARNFDLLSDLYEHDPSMTEFSLPFTTEEVTRVLPCKPVLTYYMYFASPPLACLQFLRPKRTETYLQYQGWEEGDESIFRMIGSGLEEETRMYLSRFASVFPDKDLYPIVDWAVRNGNTHVLRLLLEEKAPSVLWWCLSRVANDDLNLSTELVSITSFEDKVPVVMPRELDAEDIWSSSVAAELADNYCNALRLVDDANDVRRLLLMLGLQHPKLGNQDLPMPSPFGLKWELHPSEEVRAKALRRLVEVDPTFTKEMRKEVLADWRVM